MTKLYPHLLDTAHTSAWGRQNVPAELYPDFSTIEYIVPPKRPVAPPAYVFVVDTCIPEDELSAARQALAQALASMPEYAQVRPVGSHACGSQQVQTKHASHGKALAGKPEHAQAHPDVHLSRVSSCRAKLRPAGPTELALHKAQLTHCTQCHDVRCWASQL